MNALQIARGSLTVFLFEWSRSWTISRFACWCVLALFPPAMIGILAWSEFSPPREGWVILLYIMCPSVISMLGLLLWATPAIHSELESKTWIYVAVRPSGKNSVLIGKYLTAVAWSASAAWSGLTLSVGIIAIAGEYGQPFQLWIANSILIVLACFAYGALYCLFGVLFKRRAMAIAVAFTLVEFVISRVPALVNRFTVQHRVQNLWHNWLDLQIEQGETFTKAPNWEHLLVLVVYSLIMLAASSLFLGNREQITADES